jgi:hypothetical protein
MIDYRPPSPGELRDIRVSVMTLLWRTAWCLADRDEKSRPPVPGDASLNVQDQRDSWLALLNSIGVFYAVLESFEKDAARRAGRLGASYPMLADAWSVTRQGARRRWPDAVAALDDGPLRKALAAVVAGLSSASLRPETSARMFQPMIHAAGAGDGSSPATLVLAAERLLAVPPPEPEDAEVVIPLLDALREALEETRPGVQPESPESGQWQRFLDQ